MSKILAKDGGGEDPADLLFVVPASCHLLGAGEKKAEVNDQLKIDHNGRSGAQGAVYRRSQNSGFVRDNDQRQKIIGKREQIQHKGILQQDLFAAC